MPTPVRRLDLDLAKRPSEPELRGRLWVKDEGLASPAYGGNKVRKLEYLLADAKERGATDLVTWGAVGSHHVLATAVHGAAHDLRTHALLFAQPATAHVRRNALAIDQLCASWAVLPDLGRGAVAAAAHVLRVRRATGRTPYLVPIGGTSPLGVLGWIEGGIELAGQLPEARRVYVAVGTGGTAAGLLAGLAVAGSDAEVVAVRVAPRLVANRAWIRALARRALAVRGSRARLGRLRMVHHWSCGAYGRFDARVERAVARAGEVGLALETTYTGKAFGAAVEELERDEVEAVFVNTASAVQPPVREAELPPELDALLR